MTVRDRDGRATHGRPDASGRFPPTGRCASKAIPLLDGAQDLSAATALHHRAPGGMFVTIYTMSSREQLSGRRYYPALLDLEGKRCVVVGGGEIAERKVQSLLECGAQIVVIAPQTTQAIGDLARQGRVELSPKSYTRGDLAGALLVIAAATPDVNARVAREARQRRILVNVVDDPEHCDFIVPAVARRGPVLVAISSHGSSPALARRLRQLIEGCVGPEYGELAELMGRLRPEVMTIANEDERRRIWEAILDSRALELLRQGRRDEAELEARRCISSARD
jgi:precorrin-2 dehydrogenase/sirohydrochlorin ferrochelatase